MNIENILYDVKEGVLSIDDAISKMRYLPLEDIQYAVIDYNGFGAGYLANNINKLSGKV